jgi:hypothetical protein
VIYFTTQLALQDEAFVQHLRKIEAVLPEGLTEEQHKKICEHEALHWAAQKIRSRQGPTTTDPTDPTKLRVNMKAPHDEAWKDYLQE